MSGMIQTWSSPSLLFPLLLFLLLGLTDVASGSSNLVEECHTRQRHVDIQTSGAQVLLGAIFPIHKEGGSNRRCGDYDEGTMQLYEAVRWGVGLINSRSLAGNGIKLGIKAWDNCYVPTNAVWDTLQFYPEDQSQPAYCNVTDPVLTMGILGPFSSWSSLPVARLLATYPASQISYGAASTELNDKRLYPYFMRTNLLSLLRKLNWYHVVVIYTDDSYGMDGYKEFLRVAHNSDICISQAVKILSTDSANDISAKVSNLVTTQAVGGLMFSPSARTNNIMDTLYRRNDAGTLQWIVNDLHVERSSTNPYPKGSLLMSPKSMMIEGFREHWVRLDPRTPPIDNPWYSGWFMTKYLCKLSNTVPQKFQSYPFCEFSKLPTSDFEQYYYVEPTLISLFTFAKAIKNAQWDKCFQTSGICQNLLKMSAKEFHEKYLKNIEFTFTKSDGIPSFEGKRIRFDSNGNLENPEFLLWNYREENGANKFVEVGSFVHDWNLKPLVFYDRNRITPLTAPPTSLCPRQGCPVCVTPQLKLDIFHIPGDVLIGGIFSIHNKGKLPFTCGSVNLEDIQALMAFRYAIKNIKTHFPKIIPGISIGAVYSDVCENSGLIENILAGFLSEREVYRDEKSNRLIDPELVLAYITSLENPQAFTASTLLGQFKFPQIESKAMSIRLSSKDRFPYLSRTSSSEETQLGVISQILKSNNWTYIQVVSDRPEVVVYLKKLTSTISICITEVHTIATGNYDDVVSGLKRNVHARAVVVIAGPSDVNGLLKAMERHKVSNDFLLIGTSSWGTSNSAVKDVGSAADGSLTLTAVDGVVDGFLQYLDRQDPRSDKVLSMWYQVLFNCYLNAGSKGSYRNKCGNNKLTSSSKFTLGRSVYSTINAVYVAAVALNRTITHYCGINNGVCPAFRASRDRAGALILETMRDTTILDDNQRVFAMRNGQAGVSYRVNRYTQGRGYTTVGSYDTQKSQLTLPGLTSSSTSSLVSTCPSCYECYRINNENFANNEASLMVAAIFGIHHSASATNTINTTTTTTTTAANTTTNTTTTTTTTLSHCGEIARMSGYQFVSALEYAISTVNEGRASVSLHGIPLGSLVLDNCKIRRQAFGLMSGVNSGATRISNTFRPNYVYAWLTDTSGSAEEMGKLAAELGVPLLSPVAASNALVNPSLYSTFYRTVPGEDVVASAIAKLCTEMDFAYIQVVLSGGDSLSENSLKVLESKLDVAGICIVSKHRFSSGQSAADIMTSLRQSMIPTVLFVSSREMEELLESKKVPSDDDLVLISPDIITTSNPSLLAAKAKNLLTFRIKNSINTTGYMEFMSSLRPDPNKPHGFFEEYYQDMFECDLPGNYKFGSPCSIPYRSVTKDPRFSVDSIVGSTINALYVTVKALDMTLEQLCGSKYSAVCDQFYVKARQPEYLLKNLAEAKVPGSILSSSGFQFSDNRGATSGEYEVMRHDGKDYRTVGTYDGSTLGLDNLLVSDYSSVVRSCPSGQCDSCAPHTANFTFIPGDTILAGVFDVHERGLNLFSCGRIKLYNGFQNLEAFNFAIEEVNKKTGLFENKLKGVKLGGIGLDSCNNDVKAGNLISNLNNGMLKVESKNKLLEPKDILAYIGGGSSDSTIYLDRILRSIHSPLVGYAATSTQLNDKYAFPNFLRTVPADNRLAQALVDFLKHFKISYVQIVHSSSSYGKDAALVFKQLALEHKICVVQTVQFMDQGISQRDSAQTVLRSLLRKRLVNIVVVFAETLYLQDLFVAIKQESKSVQENFKFIGGVKNWNERLDLLQGFEDVAEGSVSISIDSVDVREFDEYLDGKSLDYNKNNPWFSEYYEGMFDCYLAKPKYGLTNKCSSSSNRVVRSSKYLQDKSVLSVVNSVYATALGLHQTLIDLCGVNYNGLCNAFKGSNTSDRLYNNIKRVSFKDLSGQQFDFNEAGDGNKGYTFFQVQKMQPSGYTYKKIASANNAGSLTQVSNTFIPWKIDCANSDACSQCFPTEQPTRRYSSFPDETSYSATSPVIVGIFDVHSAGNRRLMQCGKLNVEDTLHLIAFFDSIERENSRSKSEKIIGLALDTCGHPLHVDQDTYSLLSSGSLCYKNNPKFDPANIYSFFTMHEANVVAANRVLPYFKASYLSPDLTSAIFDDLNVYKYLFRSGGSSFDKVMLISRVLKAKAISPVAVVYSNDAYHKALLQTFREESAKDGICIEEILVASDNVFASKVTKRATRAIVLLTSPADGMSILNQAKQVVSGKSPSYLFIGADNWMKGQTRELAATGQVFLLVTETKFDNIQPFVRKIKAMNFTNRLGLPEEWFNEFYQRFHGCSLTPTPDTTPCTKLETVTNEMISGINQTAILSTIAGTRAIAQAIRDWNTVCKEGTQPPPSNCNLTTPGGRLRFWSQLNDVEFKMEKSLLKPETALDFRFTRQSWSPGYLVQELDENNGQYSFNTVATSTNGAVTPATPPFTTVTEAVLQTILYCPACQCLNKPEVTGSKQPETESLIGGSTLLLKESTIRNYFHYNSDGNRLFDWPLWAIVLAVLTSIGIISTVLLFFYLLIVYPIRGGTTSLGFIFLIGILGMYGVNFAFFAQASVVVCGARRFVTTIVYAMCFACLCVKAVDNWRNRNNDNDSHDYHRLSSSTALAIITFVIVLVQIILNVEWLLLVKPSSTSLYPTMTMQTPMSTADPLVYLVHDYQWCSPANSYDSGLALSFIFVIILDLFAILFGSMLWDSDKNYFESRWIVIASLCSSSCFLVWMVVSTCANPVYRDPAVAIGNFVNATALLLVMPLRKAILLVSIKKETKRVEKEQYESSIYQSINGNPGYRSFAGNSVSEMYA
ncbi:metabotropic glutamate receptor 3-like [Argonauta hians]